MSDYDVVVVGGGMVGAATACLLAARGRVAVIETGVAPVAVCDEQIDLRVSALSRASQRLLERLGAWQLIGEGRRCAYRQMRVWDAQVPPRSEQALVFDSAEIAEPDLGHIVENRRIVAALHERLAELDNVDLYAPADAEDISNGDREVTLRLADGRRLSSRLLLGADGAGSRTRRAAGIDTRGRSYEQRAVVTHVRTERPHGDVAFQRFLPDGPVALLPLYDGRSSVVWSTTPDAAAALLDAGAQEFCDALTVATDQVLGRVIDCDARAAFPLRLQQAEHYVRGRIALVGDAAHTVHPLAGQGVNLGFADAAGLLAALEGVADPGDHAALRRYERAARSRNVVMMSSLDGLHRLFTHSHPLAALVRSAGLGLVNRAGPVKQALIRRALGA